MTVSPIDVIERSDQFETAAADRELRPWEWAFIHAVDGRMRLQEVAELCGLDLPTARELVREQTEAGLLHVVTMTLDEYRRRSQLEQEFQAAAEAAVEPTADVPAAPAADVAPQAGTVRDTPLASEPSAAAEPVAVVAEPIAVVAEPVAAVAEPVAAPAEPVAVAEPVDEVADKAAGELDETPLALHAVAAVPSDRFAPETFAPDRFAPDGFAPDPFAPDRFTPDLFAAEPAAAAPVAPQKKAVSFSFDAFDDLETVESEEPRALEPVASEQPVLPEQPAAPVAEFPAPEQSEGISLSFEPSEQAAAESKPVFSGAGFVSLSFDADTPPFEIDEPVPASTGAHLSLVPSEPVAEPADEIAEEPAVQPISLSFSPDGFPIILSAVPDPVPQVASVSEGPSPAAQAPLADVPTAEPAALEPPALEPVALEAVAPEAAAPASAALAPAAPEAPAPPVPASAATAARSTAPPHHAHSESSDIVGSLIARVLSIRIK